MIPAKAADKMLDTCSPFYKAYDVALMALLVIFFAGYISIHSEVLGVPRLFPVPEQLEEFWDLFMWIIFAMLAFDIYLKYRKVGNARLFLKKHWLEVTMLAMIPLFSGLKIAKISIKLVKGLKMMKSGFKVAHGANKISKTQNKN
jgi:hypothetical protein